MSLVTLCHHQANAEKQRLETKQRAARKAADRGDPIRPRWFEPIPGTAQGEALCFRCSPYLPWNLPGTCSES